MIRTQPASVALARCIEKMQAAELPDLAIRSFARSFRQLEAGPSAGLVSEQEIVPAAGVTDLEMLSDDYTVIGAKTLGQAVAIKLNGGRGTGMKLDHAKSLIRVKQNLSFVEIAVAQVRQKGRPLVLMNSFATADETHAALQALSPYGLSEVFEFTQHQIPRIRQDNLLPVDWPADPTLEWCPPGHGDLYAALLETGMLAKLRALGCRYAFISNIDNLGATLDPTILGFMAQHQIPFLMEVADRTLADRKGGHLAGNPHGGWLLRELAQCPAEERELFQDIQRHRYFNTNNLWIDLDMLAGLLDEQQGILELSVIRNAKQTDPRDMNSPPVYQLETAAGSAIAVVPGAIPLRVPRTRFAPVKNTSDLLIVQSDVFNLTRDGKIVLNQRCSKPPRVQLDPHYYEALEAFEQRFPFGPPSLAGCEELVVQGDVVFGENVMCLGKVEVQNNSHEPLEITAGSVLQGRTPPGKSV